MFRSLPRTYRFFSIPPPSTPCERSIHRGKVQAHEQDRHRISDQEWIGQHAAPSALFRLFGEDRDQERINNTVNDHHNFNVCLSGATVLTGNMGCSALAASLIRLVLESRPNARISLLDWHHFSEYMEVKTSQKSAAMVRALNCRLYPRAKLRDHILWILALALLYRFLLIMALQRRVCAASPWLKAFEEADFVGDIRGGDSFSDIYGLRNFLQGSASALVALLMEKDLVLLPQIYGPFRSFIARRGFIPGMPRASTWPGNSWYGERLPRVFSSVRTSLFGFLQ